MHMPNLPSSYWWLVFKLDECTWNPLHHIRHSLCKSSCQKIANIWGLMTVWLAHSIAGAFPCVEELNGLEIEVLHNLAVYEHFKWLSWYNWKKPKKDCRPQQVWIKSNEEASYSVESKPRPHWSCCKKHLWLSSFLEKLSFTTLVSIGQSRAD